MRGWRLIVRLQSVPTPTPVLRVQPNRGYNGKAPRGRVSPRTTGEIEIRTLEGLKPPAPKLQLQPAAGQVSNVT